MAPCSRLFSLWMYTLHTGSTRFPHKTKRLPFWCCPWTLWPGSYYRSEVWEADCLLRTFRWCVVLRMGSTPLALQDGADMQAIRGSLKSTQDKRKTRGYPTFIGSLDFEPHSCSRALTLVYLYSDCSATFKHVWPCIFLYLKASLVPNPFHYLYTSLKVTLPTPAAFEVITLFCLWLMCLCFPSTVLNLVGKIQTSVQKLNCLLALFMAHPSLPC